MDDFQNSGKGIFSVKYTFLLIALVLICRMFANCTLPVFEPSEARYANVCKNMAVSGNYLEPKFIHNGKMQTFEGKPPLYFQMGGICCKIFKINEFAVRFPAVLSAIGLLLAIFYTMKTIRDEKAACISTLFCALTPVFLLYCGLCMTDLLLTFTICAAVCFYILFSAEKNRFRKKIFSTLFFAAMGVGMMVKGPVALVTAGLPLFFYTLLNNRWKDLKDHAWFSGILVFLLITGPWYIIMQSKNPDFLEYFFINENFKRFLFKNYGDRYGVGRETFRGMAFVYMLLCNLPFLLLALIPLFKKEQKDLTFKKVREYLQDPLTGIAFLWFASNTIFWCMTSRVLITYLLPTIPAVSILLADLLERTGLLQSGKAKHRFRIGLTILCVIYCAGGLLIGSCMPEIKSNAGHFFAYLTTLKQYEKYQFYFAKNTPYAAEFYMGERVLNHPRELRTEALEQSKSTILLATDKDLLRLERAKPLGRKIIAKNGPWIAFAPEKNTETINPAGKK